MFGPLVIAYLFLGGTGAGACMVASAVGLMVPARELAPQDGLTLAPFGEYKRLLSPALCVAAGAVMLGVFCLLADLGNPLAAFGVITGGATSWANVGVAALVLCVAVCAAQAALIESRWRLPLRLLRILQVIGLPAGFMAALYTGLLLMSMSGVPFWSSPFLPALFALSAASCGMAVFAASTVLSGAWDFFAGSMSCLAKADAVLVAVEALALIGFLAVNVSGHSAQASAAASVQDLLVGPHRFVFWLGAVLAGLAVPFASELLMTRFAQTSAYHLTAHVLSCAAFCLAGALCLRFCIVAAGAHPYLGVLG